MRTNQGFITKILLIVIALIALKYYLDFDLIGWIKSPSGQKVVGPIWSVIKNFYNWLDILVRGWVG